MRVEDDSEIKAPMDDGLGSTSSLSSSRQLHYNERLSAALTIRLKSFSPPHFYLSKGWRLRKQLFWRASEVTKSCSKKQS